MNECSMVSKGAENLPYTPPQSDAVKHWQDMRFGMFIHWGPASLTAHEIGWSRGEQTPIEKYDNLYKEFNPTNFNADEWVKVAKDAGMKYMVLTTKHHDGFCLWNTRETDYSVMNSPFRRDVVKELSDACKKQGMAFGAYYSVCDWHHPSFPLTSPGGSKKRETFDLDSYNRYLLAQIKELIINYGPLLYIWNDMPQMFDGRGTNTINMVRALQPDILINDRTGDGGDFGTPEQTIGEFNMNKPWESCMTVSRSGIWAWGGEKDGVKSLEECLLMLIRAVGGDGNVLLNVGPRPDGVIDPLQANRLKEMGQWLAKYGESIYATRGGPYKPASWGVSTRKGNKVFLHVVKWPSDGVLQLPVLSFKVKSVKKMTGQAVDLSHDDKTMSLSVPVAIRDEIDTVIVLELEDSAMDLTPVSAAGGTE